MRRFVFCVLVSSLGSVLIHVSDGADTQADQAGVQSVTTKPGGTLSGDEVWTAAGGPYRVTGTLTIPAGRTLTIEAGTSVYLASGVSLVVANGGRLLAEGTETQEIQFTSPPGSGTSWGGMTINGAVGSPETRIAYAYIQGNGNTCIEVAAGTLYLDHATFGTTTHQYVSLDGSSFLISHCTFPTTTASFELLHGNGGIKSGGHGIVRDSFFGTTTGYNDIMDFTGGNREQGQPIVQYYNNVFVGASDDVLDLDGTDAWIEGNIFLHSHRNGGTPDSSAAVSGGSYGSDISQITILGNLFFDCDNAATAKQGNFFTLINNTIVHTTKKGGVDYASGVVNPWDTNVSQNEYGAGFYLEGNVIVDAEQLVRSYNPAKSIVTLNNNILPMPWDGPGTGNVVVDPQLKYVPQVSETYFTSWEEAQVLRDWFSLQPGSFARGTGPNGTDMGGVIPLGVSVWGEPSDTTSMTSATLTVGVNRTGSGIPAAGFPLGSGFTRYRWRLDTNAWSAETPIATPIKLTGLAEGPHHVEVIGKNDAGTYQNDPSLGADAVVTMSSTWTVDPAYWRLRINEVLANNVSAMPHGDSYPGVVELYYEGPGPLDLSGMTMTNDANYPTRFIFPAGTTMTAGQYLVLFADSNAVTPGIHLGFALADNGDRLYLYDKNGTLLDSVEFGQQLPDLSIGRVRPEEGWRLTVPTPGQANVACPNGNPEAVRINEWLTSAQVLFPTGFIELYNPQANPVDLGGTCLTNDPVAKTPLCKMGPLSFIPGNGYPVFWADGLGGPWHLSSPPSPAGGTLTLLDGDLKEIDQVVYGPQTTDVSQGRVPDGAATIEFLPLPTPGVANPSDKTITTTTVTLVQEGANKRVLVPTAAVSDNWKGGRPFDDSGWTLCARGPGGVGYDTNPDYKPLITLDTQAQMYGSGKNNTCYIRVPFTVDANALADINSLTLKVRYDDGFVAYLNGTEVARRNFTGTPLWNSHADSAIEAAITAFDAVVDISQYKGQLKAGTNILAIHAMNASSTSSDFLISVAMDAVLVRVESTLVLENDLNLLQDLRVTELMYNAPEGDALDFIELRNTGATVLDLTGVRFTQGIDFVFPEGTLAPGQYVVVGNEAALRSKYGTTVNVAGQYSGQLSNAGEQIVLNLPLPLEAAILRFAYDEAWYPTTNGGGDSLVINDPLALPATWSQSQSWHAAAPSPGRP